MSEIRCRVPKHVLWLAKKENTCRQLGLFQISRSDKSVPSVVAFAAQHADPDVFTASDNSPDCISYFLAAFLHQLHAENTIALDGVSIDFSHFCIIVDFTVQVNTRFSHP